MRPALPWLLAGLTGLISPLPARAQSLSLETQVGVAQVRTAGGGALQAWRRLDLQLAHGDWQAQLQLPTCLASRAAAPATADCGAASHAARTLAPSREARLRWDAPWTGPQGLSVALSALAWHSPGRPGLAGDHGSQLEWELGAPLPGGWNAWLGQGRPLARNDSSAWRSAFAGLAWQHHSGLDAELAWDDARDTRSAERDRRLSLRLAWQQDPGARWRLKLLRALDEPGARWQLQAGLDWRL